MQPFEDSLNSLIEQKILKKHHGVNGEYAEYRILNKLPNGEKGADHPDFELKSTKYGSEITLADLSSDYFKSYFTETHAYEKCKSMVYVPWKRVNGKKTFIDFHHVTRESWHRIIHLLETDFHNIVKYVHKHGVDDLRSRSSSNYATTKYLRLYRCKDRFSESKQTIVKPALRLKITFKTFRMLLGENE